VAVGCSCGLLLLLPLLLPLSYFEKAPKIFLPQWSASRVDATPAQHIHPRQAALPDFI